ETRGQVAAQRDEMADAAVLVALQRLADAVAGGRDARDVRRGRVPARLDVEHGLERAIARGAACTVGDGGEFGAELGELTGGDAQLLPALRRVGREEFEAIDPG